MSVLDRFLLLATSILAGYQIAVGLEDAVSLTIFAYTTAFGVLLLAGLLLLIFGFELLDSAFVAVVATIIPLALSLGLVCEYLPGWRVVYLLVAGPGFALVLWTRLAQPGRTATMTLALVHGAAGLLIFGLPLLLSLRGATAPGFVLVGIGGALIGVGGLALSFLKMDKPLLSQEIILTLLPALLLLMTFTFVVGFAVV